VRFEPIAESATAVQVERGSIWPHAMANSPSLDQGAIERLIELTGVERLGSVAVVDRMGHHRSCYRPLLIYCWLQTFSQHYETLPRSEFGRWEEGLRAWCDLLESELGANAWPSGPISATRGASACEAAWTSLALHQAGKLFIRDAWTDLASDFFGKLARAQQPSGAFLLAGGSDNPETLWYHELVLLHAAGSYAVQSEDRPLAIAVARNAKYHLNETQPDHATSQPWGIFPMIWNASTRSLAEQTLHSMRVADGASPLSLMLLADALYCVELFFRKTN
jgi:hypothetical protein